MRIERLSEKQRRVLTWWCDASPDRGREAILCDGAVRSGKTWCMGLSFFLWAMARFDGAQFALCGKTIGGLRRNLLAGLLPQLRRMGVRCREQVSKNTVTAETGRRRNTFYLFGGKDEGSAALIQGVTLAGALLDEAALMPQSFVEQTAARCSVRGARLWLNCNPEGPEHWLYREWVLKAEERNMLYLHFTMEDNPGLDRRTVERFKRQFSGAFFRRYVLGEWVAAEGRVYDFFDESCLRDAPEGGYERWYISCDYLDGERRAMAVYGPGGYQWSPAPGQEVLVLKNGGTGAAYCVAAARTEGDCAPGEVRISAPGGAAVQLRSDGRVELTGRVVINGVSIETLVEQLAGGGQKDGAGGT